MKGALVSCFSDTRWLVGSSWSFLYHFLPWVSVLVMGGWVMVVGLVHHFSSVLCRSSVVAGVRSRFDFGDWDLIFMTP